MRPPPSVSRPPLLATSSCPPCTLTTRRARRTGSSRWASSRSWPAVRSTVWWLSAWPGGSANAASERSVRTRGNWRKWPGLSGDRNAGRAFPGRGCQVCGKTGYIGRFAVHEVLNVNEEIERMIVEHAHAEDIQKAAIADGMVPLRYAGLHAARPGRPRWKRSCE